MASPGSIPIFTHDMTKGITSSESPTLPSENYNHTCAVGDLKNAPPATNNSGMLEHNGSLVINQQDVGPSLYQVVPASLLKMHSFPLNLKNLTLNPPKAKKLLNEIYNKHPTHSKQVTGKHYISWNDQNKSILERWTSVFICPVTGEVFLARRRREKIGHTSAN